MHRQKCSKSIECCSTSSFTWFVRLFVAEDDKGKKVYQPTVFQMGFQRTDVALMSPFGLLCVFKKQKVGFA